MKKSFYLVSILALMLFTVVVYTGGDGQGDLSSNVLYSSVMDASVTSDVPVVSPSNSNPEFPSFAPDSTKLTTDEVKAISVTKDKSVKKKVRRMTKTVATDKVALTDTSGTQDETKVTVEDCSTPNLSSDEATYDAQLVTVRKKFQYELGEEFKVKVYVKNAGNMPWFSPESKCEGSRIYLGTTRDDDRSSHFYYENSKKDTGWFSSSRVRLDKGQTRVDPGEIASFTFYGKADYEDSIYREFFAPVLDDGSFLKSAEFKIDIYSGENDISDADLRKKLSYAYKSLDVNELNVDGKKSVEVDLSDQKLYLKIDNFVIREFRVSSGKASTPTPQGTFKIMLKNEVRVGAESPHYIMPNFQMFTSQGAGLHALPSLGSDGGVFWTEAKEHIGRPVSHGCVRMLPEDATFAYEFTDVGDPITIHW